MDKGKSPTISQEPRTSATMKKGPSSSVVYESYDVDELRNTYIKNQEKLRELNRQIQNDYACGQHPQLPKIQRTSSHQSLQQLAADQEMIHPPKSYLDHNRPKIRDAVKKSMKGFGGASKRSSANDDNSRSSTDNQLPSK